MVESSIAAGSWDLPARSRGNGDIPRYSVAGLNAAIATLLERGFAPRTPRRVGLFHSRDPIPI